jgi:hypothetical protein
MDAGVPNRSLMQMTRALLMAGLLAIPGLQSVPAAARSHCEKPQPVFRYTGEQAIASLTVKLAGCQWWKGSGIEVDGELQQSLLGEGVAASRYCGVAQWAGEGLRPPKVQRVTRCTLRLRLTHAPVEAQTYEGSFTFPWRTGPETVDFAYLCVSGAQHTECRET